MSWKERAAPTMQRDPGTPQTPQHAPQVKHLTWPSHNLRAYVRAQQIDPLAAEAQIRSLIESGRLEDAQRLVDKMELEQVCCKQ